MADLVLTGTFPSAAAWLPGPSGLEWTDALREGRAVSSRPRQPTLSGLDADRSLESLSLLLFDTARGALQRWVEHAVSARVVPLRIRWLEPTRSKDQGDLLQDQATYERHFPRGAFGVSVVVAAADTHLVLLEDQPAHGLLLQHAIVSERVWGAHLTDIALGKGKRSMVPLPTGATLLMSAYAVHNVPLSTEPLLSFDYRTSPYRQALNPVVA